MMKCVTSTPASYTWQCGADTGRMENKRINCKCKEAVTKLVKSRVFAAVLMQLCLLLELPEYA